MGPQQPSEQSDPGLDPAEPPAKRMKRSSSIASIPSVAAASAYAHSHAYAASSPPSGSDAWPRPPRTIVRLSPVPADRSDLDSACPSLSPQTPTLDPNAGWQKGALKSGPVPLRWVPLLPPSSGPESAKTLPKLANISTTPNAATPPIGLGLDLSTLAFSPSGPSVGHVQSARSPGPSRWRSKSPLNPTLTLKLNRHNVRARAREAAWKAGLTMPKPLETNAPAPCARLSLPHHPYRTAAHRQEIQKHPASWIPIPAQQPPVPFHVDFCAREVDLVRAQLWNFARTRKLEAVRRSEPLKGIKKLFKQLRKMGYAAEALGAISLARRTEEDVVNFFSDIMTGTTSPVAAVVSIEPDEYDDCGAAGRASKFTSLLFDREIYGARGCIDRGLDVQQELRSCVDDELQLTERFTGGAGDVTTCSWVSESNLICGTTTHSDPHNQQYNRPGNLALGSVVHGTLRSFNDHRIPRPIVETGENATEAMRQSQDPWLYTSVVSSAFDRDHNVAFTSSFDRTVKLWRVNEHASGMRCLGTWQHEGNANFVTVSKDRSCISVATAADVAVNAIRVYRVYPSDLDGDVSNAPYTTYTCARTPDSATENSDKWTYCPATMQWGLSRETQNLLLVGYSPRALKGYDDSDIPEQQQKTGEVCLWDCKENRRVDVMTATTQNVFEVAWHPTLPSFIVATTPFGLTKPRINTEIHIFHLNTSGLRPCFSDLQVLDCPAHDINELTIMPICPKSSYITAAATDGNVYVWDTAQGDDPIHKLKHGEPLEPYIDNREHEDMGVKFMAWGRTANRFYTGGSDGVVKVWNVRSQTRPLVRVLLEAPGAISCGAFSPGQTHLAIGDSTGQVHILSVHDEGEREPVPDEEQDHHPPLPAEAEQALASLRARGLLPGTGISAARKPRQQIPFKEEDTSHEGPFGREYVERGELVRHLDPCIGMVKGPNYHSTGLFDKESHLNGEPNGPLMASVEAGQWDIRDGGRGKAPRGGWTVEWPNTLGRPRAIRPLTRLQLRRIRAAQEDQRKRAGGLGTGLGLSPGLDLYSLALEEQEKLRADGVDFDQGDVDLFEGLYEEDAVSEYASEVESESVSEVESGNVSEVESGNVSEVKSETESGVESENISGAGAAEPDLTRVDFQNLSRAESENLSESENISEEFEFKVVSAEVGYKTIPEQVQPESESEYESNNRLEDGSVELLPLEGESEELSSNAGNSDSSRSSSLFRRDDLVVKSMLPPASRFGHCFLL